MGLTGRFPTYLPPRAVQLPGLMAFGFLRTELTFFTRDALALLMIVSPLVLVGSPVVGFPDLARFAQGLRTFWRRLTSAL